MTDAERAGWLRLAFTPNLGPVAARRLLSVFGLPDAVFGASPASLAPVVGEPLARVLAAAPDELMQQTIARTAAWLAQDNAHRLLTLADGDYPPGLLTISDPPPLLFAVGRTGLLAQPAIAIVGSRNATRQGAATAAAFAAGLSRAGLSVVSGLALGIDSAAHAGALDAGGGSIAVVGTGIDLVYPASNRRLTERMRAEGLVLSELPPGMPPLTHNFPRRNRLISGLARGVLVVEAALRSGSLITARLAAEQGREVFAIPGSIHSPMAKGCHRLLKDGAKLVEEVNDVLTELGMLPLPPGRRPGTNAGAAPAAVPAGLPAAQAALLALMGHDPVTLDALADRSGQPAGALTALLLELELAQHVERLPGNLYQRLG